MSKVMKAEELAGKSPEEIIELLNKGVKIVETAAPFVKQLFDKISDLFANIGSNNPNGPKNRLKRIEILEAQNKLAKENNKLLEARIAALEAKG